MFEEERLDFFRMNHILLIQQEPSAKLLRVGWILKTCLMINAPHLIKSRKISKAEQTASNMQSSAGAMSGRNHHHHHHQALSSQNSSSIYTPGLVTSFTWWSFPSGWLFLPNLSFVDTRFFLSPPGSRLIRSSWFPGNNRIHLKILFPHPPHSFVKKTENQWSAQI